MSTISKLISSAADFSLEIAPALAVFNFDFSLYKVQPPKEFEGVGSALSKFRREEAESGTAHITARKLGALFDGLLPSTPRLIRAYGERASEISQSSSVTSQGRSNYGVFGSRIGADATSIWAAATSGHGAIAVHLLACLLARIWEGPEATSIWVEIVKCRKEDILATFDDTNIADIATLSASKQDLTRIQLAEWDASARAWLRVADSVKKRQQKQLMLITDNLQAPVNRKSDTYQSVMSAWTDSMSKMEGLVQGISQKAQSGDILLASSAWHLFPDMMIVNPCVANVQQNDPIFTSGVVLTVGLEKSHSEHTGVYWSLPLAHLRHYGAPVRSIRSIDSNERSRISLDEFLQAFLGCFLKGWKEAESDAFANVKWLSYVSDILHEAALCGSNDASRMIRGDAKSSWLNLLFLAAKRYLSSSGNERLSANKLISLGRKHGKSFLGLPKEPVFGLLNRGAFVGIMQDEDEKIRFLRSIANEIVPKMKLRGRQVFIRYKHSYSDWAEFAYEYATAVPWSQETLKRKSHQLDHDVQGYFRWLYAGGNLHRRVEDARYYHRLDDNYINHNGTSDSVVPVNFSDYKMISSNLNNANRYSRHKSLFRDWDAVPTGFKEWHGSRGYQNCHAPWSDRFSFSEEKTHYIREEFESRKKHYQARGEYVHERDHELIEDFAVDRMGIFWDQPHESGRPWYQFMYGDLDSAALFITEGEEKLADLYITPKEVSSRFHSLFEGKKVKSDILISRISEKIQMAQVEADPHLKSLKAVSTAAMMYRHFCNATIDIRVLQQRLYDTFWVPVSPTSSLQLAVETVSALQPYELNRAESFACVAMFESGQYNINPIDLENVMAMSSEDSLYIGAELLRDPFESSFGSIQRVAGNIGRPGLAFLVPPVDPLIKKVSMSEWPQINRHAFDGELRDCFESTSLHLSFTGATDSLNVGFTGAQDAEVYLLETLISVHERGKWIADFDPFRICWSVNLSRVLPCASGTCNSGCPKLQMTCIDNWLELIDTPEENVSLVRAHKNWQARLAATSLSIQMGFRTVVLPEKVCYGCLYSSHGGSYDKIIVIG